VTALMRNLTVRKVAGRRRWQVSGGSRGLENQATVLADSTEAPR